MTAKSIRLMSGIGLLLLTSVCGGGSPTTPVAPSPSVPTTPTNPTPTTTWSVAGRLVETVSQQPVSGAQIAPTWDLAAVTTGADGGFQLGAVANPPTTPYKLTVSRQGLLSRDVWVTWQRGARSDITLDLINTAAPFSMEFYRQLVRGTYDQPGAPWPVLRWTVAPRFYVRTVDQNGRDIEPEVLATVHEGIERAVPIYTGGRFAVAALESGRETRPDTSGWINVHILRDPNEKNTCGRAFIGANPNTITLYNDVCACGSRKILGATVLHEVGHAMGFFHVSDRSHVMYPFIPGNCPSGDPSANERYHAAIAYSRPRGNLDPDNDPSSGQLQTAATSIRILADR